MQMYNFTFCCETESGKQVDQFGHIQSLKLQFLVYLPINSETSVLKLYVKLHYIFLVLTFYKYQLLPIPEMYFILSEV